MSVKMDALDTLREAKRLVVTTRKAQKKAQAEANRAIARCDVATKAMLESEQSYSLARAAVLESNPEAFKL